MNWMKIRFKINYIYDILGNKAGVLGGLTKMRCPYCEHRESKVIDSRYTEEYTCIRRRRECLSCKERFTTMNGLKIFPDGYKKEWP